MKIFNVPAGQTKENSLNCFSGNVFGWILAAVHECCELNPDELSLYVPVNYAEPFPGNKRGGDKS